MAPKLIPFFNSMEDFANDDNKQLVVFKYSSIETDILVIIFSCFYQKRNILMHFLSVTFIKQEATTGILAKLGKKLRSHPENSIDSVLENSVIGVQHKVCIDVSFFFQIKNIYLFCEFLFSNFDRQDLLPIFMYFKIFQILSSAA